MVKRLKELLFQNRSTRQTITKNVFWLSIGQIASRLIRAVIIIYSARVLGAAEYGIFSYALGLAGFFTIFADIGINQTLTREMAQKPERLSNYFSTAFWIKIFLFLITAALVMVVAPHFSKIEKIASIIPFVALIVIFDGLREFTLSLFRAREKMEFEAMATLLTNAAITALGFAALYFSTTSQSLTFSYAIATGIGALASIIILKTEFKKVINFFDKNLIKPLFSSAWPVALTGIIGAFMLNTDIIMLGWWRTAEEIGLYSASQKIIQMLYALPAILAGATFPTISRFVGQKDDNKTRQLIEISMTAVFLIAVPLTIGGIILGKPIIELIYGKEYLPAVLPFQILIATSLVIFPGTLMYNSILAYNKQKKLAVYMTIAAIGNIIFNAILIPIYGIVGSAIATIAAQLLSNSLSWMMIKKINNFSTFRYLKKIAATAIIMGIFSVVANKFGLNVIINIILSAGLYAGMLYLLKEKIFNEVIALFNIRKLKSLD